jgi:hypothetical protein
MRERDDSRRETQRGEKERNRFTIRSQSCGMLHLVVSYKLTDVSEVLTASITRGRKVLSTYETTINFHQTVQHSIPEGSHLRICCRVNLKLHYLQAKKEQMEEYGRILARRHDG